MVRRRTEGEPSAASPGAFSISRRRRRRLSGRRAARGEPPHEDRRLVRPPEPVHRDDVRLRQPPRFRGLDEPFYAAYLAAHRPRPSDADASPRRASRPIPAEVAGPALPPRRTACPTRSTWRTTWCRACRWTGPRARCTCTSSATPPASSRATARSATDITEADIGFAAQAALYDRVGGRGGRHRRPARRPAGMLGTALRRDRAAAGRSAMLTWPAGRPALRRGLGAALVRRGASLHRLRGPRGSAARRSAAPTCCAPRCRSTARCRSRALRPSDQQRLVDRGDPPRLRLDGVHAPPPARAPSRDISAEAVRIATAARRPRAAASSTRRASSTTTPGRAAPSAKVRKSPVGEPTKGTPEAIPSSGVTP